MMSADRLEDLSARIRDARARFEPLHRELGAHLERCEQCRRADSLQGPPAPFCPAGDQLLGRMAQTRFDMHMAATRLMALEGRSGPVPIQRARPDRSAASGYRQRSGRRPWTTNPRHRPY